MRTAKPTILNLGREQSFRELRHRLLVDAGFTVYSVGSAKEAEDVLGKRKVQALVIGAWVTKAERIKVVSRLKECCPQAFVVFYYDEKIDGTELADAILNVRGDHNDLVRTLQHLMARASKQDRGGSGAGGLKNLATVLASVATSMSDLGGSLLPVLAV